MRQFYKYFICGAAILAALSSCCRRSLEDGYEPKAVIPIRTVWTRADIVPQNVTAMFYDQRNGKLAVEHRFENNANAVQSYVDLAAGKYTVVVFNEIRGQVQGVGIRGYENLATLEAYALPRSDVRIRAVGDEYVSDPAIMASALVRNFEVTQQMVEYTLDPDAQPNSALDALVEALLGLTPERCVHRFDMTVHVNGLHNARMPALVDLRDIAEAYGFNAERNMLIPAAQQFMMNNRTYDPGSTKNGTISTSVYTFGLLGEKPASVVPEGSYPVWLDVSFILVDAARTFVKQSVDVTSLITFQSETHGATTLQLYLNLPDPLPDVVPEGGGSSGFEAELIDWDVIDVPLTAN